jgi:hypothetical protein
VASQKRALLEVTLGSGLLAFVHRCMHLHDKMFFVPQGKVQRVWTPCVSHLPRRMRFVFLPFPLLPTPRPYGLPLPTTFYYYVGQLAITAAYCSYLLLLTATYYLLLPTAAYCYYLLLLTAAYCYYLLLPAATTYCHLLRFV